MSIIWKSVGLVALLVLPLAAAHGPTTVTRNYAAVEVTGADPCLAGTSGAAVCFAASDLTYAHVQVSVQDASGLAVATQLAFLRANGAPLPGVVSFCGELTNAPIPPFASRALVTFPAEGCDGAVATAGVVVARLYDHH